MRIFEADIIYHLEDDFNNYLEEIQEAKKAAAAEDAVFPCILQILPDNIFNTKVSKAWLRRSTTTVC